MTIFKGRARPLVAAALLAASCGAVFTRIEDAPCPPQSTLTYEGFGAGFMTAYCQGCHGSAATDRAGAPGELIFDTPEQVRRHRERIFIRAAGDNTTMPPGPEDPPLEARQKLAEWLACGAR